MSLFACGGKKKNRETPEKARLRATSSLRFSSEDREMMRQAALRLQQMAPQRKGLESVLEPEPEPEPESAESAKKLLHSPERQLDPANGRHHARARRAPKILPPWTRQKLCSDWGPDKAEFVGNVGKVVHVDKIGKQVELTFGHDRNLHRLVYPISAVGLRKIGTGTGLVPLDDAAVLLSVGTGTAQQWCDQNKLEVQVRSDPKLVETCFRQQHKPFVEDATTDRHAVVSCGVAFFAAFAAGGVTEALGLGRLVQVAVALPLWLAVAYNAIYLERRRVRWIELLSEREAKSRREQTSIPDEENVEWLNGVLRKVWGPLEPRISRAVQWTAQSAVDEMVIEPYVAEIKISELSLGQSPPVVRYASYMPSEVYGEFKINTRMIMGSPEMKVGTLVTVCIGGLDLEIPVQLTHVAFEVNLQLAVRVSEEQGLTMIGVMLNEPVKLDYCLAAFGLFGLSSMPMISDYLTKAINDSLWWMRKPEVLEIPMVPNADLDPDLSRPTRNIGLLEIKILQARGLSSSLSHSVAHTFDPYVKVSLRSKKDRSIITRKSGSEEVPRFEEETLVFAPTGTGTGQAQNPTWGQEFHLALRANECHRRDNAGVLCFEVYDKDITEDRQLGEVTVELWELITSPEFAKGYVQWLPLRLKGAETAIGSAVEDRGQLRVAMHWHPKLLAKHLPISPSTVETLPNDIVSGILEITTKACRRLTATSGNKDDPYVSIDVGGLHEWRTAVVEKHSFPTWDEGSFDFPIINMNKVIRIQLHDARKDKLMGSVLRNGPAAPRHSFDFPSVAELLKTVGLVRGGRVMLTETADLWLPLNNPTTGKLTSQEIHLGVSFRACRVHLPRCNAVFVTNIPVAWASQPYDADAQHRYHTLRQVLELAFYGAPPEGFDALVEHLQPCPCPICHETYMCAAGRVREVYCPALELQPREENSQQKTWALVVLRSSDDATAFVRERYVRNYAFVSAATKHAHACGTDLVSHAELEAFDPTPRRQQQLQAVSQIFEGNVPFALYDMPHFAALYEEVVDHYSSYWSDYVTNQRVDGLLSVRVVTCCNLKWSDKGNKSSDRDPYAVLTTRLPWCSEIFEQFQTKVVKGTLNPRFDQTFAFKMGRHSNCRVDSLEVEIFDWNPLTKDSLLGTATIELCSMFADGWYTPARNVFPLQHIANHSTAAPPSSGGTEIDDGEGSPTTDDKSLGQVELHMHFTPDLPCSP